ncbi:basic-leucine zipper transcription factor f-related [Anaeramoeba flamelloides]|uniref:Basic-leucine zipper transcription factor f-related n=1 Tax=Anaeramoeba flamelloides TaxID=1746091 RepID=A0AAV7ZTD5_9EUKA|nr:basic-leucine zipper transcription factor f-related [Anaeramoeba flamelloides]
MSTNKSNPRTSVITRIVATRKRLSNDDPIKNKNRRILKGPVTLTVIKKKINQAKPIVLTEEQKKMKKMKRNRENAKRFRQRKKVYVKELENETKTLKEENTSLNVRLDLISQENSDLKKQIELLEAKILKEQSIQDFKEIDEQSLQELNVKEVEKEEYDREEKEEVEEEEEEEEYEDAQENVVEKEEKYQPQILQEFQKINEYDSVLFSETCFEDNSENTILGDIPSKLNCTQDIFQLSSQENGQLNLAGFEDFLLEGLENDHFEENENWV